MLSFNAASSIVTLLSVSIMALASFSFSSVVDVDGRTELSASITLVRPFLNISIHLVVAMRCPHTECIHVRVFRHL